MQWKGKEYDYDVAASGNTTDVVKKFLDACKRYDLVPGRHYNLRDFHNHPLFLNELPERRGQVPLPPDYFALVKAYLTELTKSGMAMGYQDAVRLQFRIIGRSRNRHPFGLRGCPQSLPSPPAALRRMGEGRHHVGHHVPMVVVGVRACAAEIA